MSSLLCQEKFDFQDDDDLNLDGGIKSIEDPHLLNDSRVLFNILNYNDNPNVGDANYFKSTQTEIKPHMRRIVCDWMLEVCEEQKCLPEVFSLAVNYMDRVLKEVWVAKNQFQLLACVCLFIASKFKETIPLCADKLVIYADFSITIQEIMQWELVVLKVLCWDLSAITPFCILDNLIRRLDLPVHHYKTTTVRNHSETFCALAVTEYDIYSSVSDSLLAVSSLVLSLRTLKITREQEMACEDIFTALIQLSGLKVADIEFCVSQIAGLIKQKLPNVIVKQPTNNNNSKQDLNSVDNVSLSSSSSHAGNSLKSCEKNICSSPNPPMPSSASPRDVMEVSESWCSFT